MRRVHAGDSVAAEKIHEFLLADSLHLTGLDGFGGHFMRNIGKNGAQTHHVARNSDL